jgi:hypothetical protein
MTTRLIITRESSTILGQRAGDLPEVAALRSQLSIRMHTRFPAVSTMRACSTGLDDRGSDEKGADDFCGERRTAFVVERASMRRTHALTSERASTGVVDDLEARTLWDQQIRGRKQTHAPTRVNNNWPCAGAGVKVAIFDTGLRSSHPHFKRVREVRDRVCVASAPTRRSRRTDHQLD